MPPPPPPPPMFPPPKPIVPSIPEARLEDYVSVNPQPLHKPVTHYPGKASKTQKSYTVSHILKKKETHDVSSQNLYTVAPTADNTTFRLTETGLAYASQDQLWQFGVVIKVFFC